MSRALRVAVLGGGTSSEHDVSLASAAGIAAAAAACGYTVVPLTLTRDGGWATAPDGGWALSFDEAIRVLASCDVAIPALHGVGGEDGLAAALLTAAGVPFVGSPMAAGVLAMDKWVTKLVAGAHGIASAPGALVRADGVTVGDVPALPVIVKPVAAGSSHGVSFVDDPALLGPALAEALRHDSRALVEAAVTGREVDIAVLQRADGGLTVSPALEIDLGGDTLFDTERKYGGGARFRVPAPLDAGDRALLESAARTLFRALGCGGVARFDFFLTESGPVLNEVNTMPGFTEQSQVPRMFAAAGLGYAALVRELVEAALAKAAPPGQDTEAAAHPEEDGRFGEVGQARARTRV